MAYRFDLNPGFPKKDVMALAARNPLRDREELLLEAGRRSYAAGFYTKTDFLAICQSIRGIEYFAACQANSPQHIERMTRIALSTAATERRRMLALMLLSGVAWRGAAVFLHFSFEDKYPTLAQNALWTWGHEKRVDVNLHFWLAYVDACRALRTECGVNMHTLDLALRQFAAECREHETADR